MRENEIPEFLDRVADRVDPSPPPIGAMLADARRSRRRRTTGVVAAAAAVGVIIGGTALMLPGGEDGADPAPGTASPSPDRTSELPDGYRLVGAGRAAIAVPDAWGTNRSHCGTPTRNTVVLDISAIEGCALARSSGVRSVEIVEDEPRFDFTADQTGEVDGETVQFQSTRCVKVAPLNEKARRGVLCSRTAYFPELEVSFRAESSSRPEATARADVEEILSHVTILDDRVAVPGYQRIAFDAQEKGGEKYVERLQEEGLVAEVVTELHPGMPAGFVLSVNPEPGTVTRPGETVTVTTTAPPGGPAEEVRVDVSTSHGDTDYGEVPDDQIRAGASVDLKVGDTIWAYADGKRAGTLAGELDGESLAVDDWTEGPNHPHSWHAVEPGRTKITLTITADGKRVVLGTVTVLVR